MSDESIAGHAKPAKPYNHKINGHGGHEIEVHQEPSVSMAWMGFDPPGLHSANASGLQLVSSNQGGVLNYVGYRDGRCMVTKLAVSVDADGGVSIQLVLPGEGDEYARVRTVSLERLESLIADATPEPA